MSQPAPQPYSQAALEDMFPTRDEDKRPSRPTGSWWPVRWRFPSKKQVVLAGVVACALLLASWFLAVAGPIPPLRTVAQVAASLASVAVSSFCQGFCSSAGSGGGALRFYAIIYFFDRKLDSIKSELARRQ